MSATETLAATVESLCGDLSAIRAPRGTELLARSWSTEAPLRMLLNNLDREVAERPARSPLPKCCSPAAAKVW